MTILSDSVLLLFFLCYIKLSSVKTKNCANRRRMDEKVIAILIDEEVSLTEEVNLKRTDEEVSLTEEVIHLNQITSSTRTPHTAPRSKHHINNYILSIFSHSHRCGVFSSDLYISAFTT